MDNSGPPPKENFLYERNSYQGEFSPERLIFNANLQEFAHRIGYLCALETGGKISPEDAYDQIKALWKTLKKSKNKLGIGEQPPQEPPGECNEESTDDFI